MIKDKIEIKLLTSEERKIYLGPAREAAREVFNVDVFDDERLDVEIFSESNQTGNTLPVLRQYVADNGEYMYMLICTDEQLYVLRTTCVDDIVMEVPVDTSEDVMERTIDPVPLKLNDINCFFTETGIHLLAE